MMALLLSLLVATTGVPRDVSPALVNVASTRSYEFKVGRYDSGHRYLYELNNGRWNSWGEVLGWNRYYPTRRAAVRAVVRGWMQSPTHRAILMARQYDKVGCSIRRGNDYNEFYFVCIFGDRR